MTHGLCAWQVCKPHRGRAACSPLIGSAPARPQAPPRTCPGRRTSGHGGGGRCRRCAAPPTGQRGAKSRSPGFSPAAKTRTLQRGSQGAPPPADHPGARPRLPWSPAPGPEAPPPPPLEPRPSSSEPRPRPRSPAPSPEPRPPPLSPAPAPGGPARAPPAGNMAGPPVATASRPRDPDGAAPNVVARVSQWADDHLRLVRNISTVMAVAGTMLLLRSIRMILCFLKIVTTDEKSKLRR
uniref:Uncharacterized protein n=2 Tax=Canis lupus familiaris TaxID=9615 RepID=A0A8C0T741_CANLF